MHIYMHFVIRKMTKSHKAHFLNKTNPDQELIQLKGLGYLLVIFLKDIFNFPLADDASKSLQSKKYSLTEY